MNNKYIIGKYEYSEGIVALSGLMLIAGIIYGIKTHKTAIGIILIALISGLIGFSVGSIIKAPKLINE